MNRLFRAVTDALAFTLELSALTALGFWGFHLGEVIWTKILLAVAVVAAAAILWGTFAAPKAVVKPPLAGVIAVKVIVFGAAAAALYDLRVSTLAVVFATLVLLNTTAVTILRR